LAPELGSGARSLAPELGSGALIENRDYLRNLYIKKLGNILFHENKWIRMR
jgi:hypothetical protein